MDRPPATLRHTQRGCNLRPPGNNRTTIADQGEQIRIMFPQITVSYGQPHNLWAGNFESFIFLWKGNRSWCAFLCVGMPRFVAQGLLKPPLDEPPPRVIIWMQGRRMLLGINWYGYVITGGRIAALIKLLHILTPVLAAIGGVDFSVLLVASTLPDKIDTLWRDFISKLQRNRLDSRDVKGQPDAC